MGSLFTSLVNTANALGVYQRSLNVVQNNIVNSSAPGYARQDQLILSQDFSPQSGTSGGIVAGPQLSSRDAYAENSVRSQQQASNAAAQYKTSFGVLENSLPVGSGAGIPAALDKLYASFSQLSVSPNSVISRQQVIDRAKGVAASFNGVASDLASQSANAGTQINDTLRHINEIAADIVSINKQRRANFRTAQDAGLDARLNNALEELSKYANNTVLQQSDGSVSVFLGGQTPLIIGDSKFDISSTVASGQVQLLDRNGKDITGQITGGQLGALVDIRNNVLPGFRTNLDTLASSFADTVNTTLASGLDQNGNSPSIDLFSYDATLGAASTLAVAAITPQDIAAATLADPGGNANASTLAALSGSPQISGYTFTQFYGNLSASAGGQSARAQTDDAVQGQLLLQAQSLRQDLSGVNIDKEAAKLLELQRGFQAAGQVLNVLNQLTETVLNLIR